MEISYTVLQFWRTAQDAGNDRLMYEVVIGKEETVADARAELKRVMCWKRIPRNLTVRTTHVEMNASM